MGFRFRKSITLFPGVKVNLSKNGPSLSLGGKGFTTNVSSRGVRETVGIPGTGLSYSTRLGGGLMDGDEFKHETHPAPPAKTGEGGGLIVRFLRWLLRRLGG